jgi:D-amino-acid oxidase|tara:strand:- start:6917 stop:7858 length:942 start_codon:yes stop_codon:yes gene_type:complete
VSKGHCLVVGAGVSGLSSAIRLLENDWEVTIWSSEFSPNTTSDIAAALWYPFLSAPVEKTNIWGSETYDVLKVLSRFPQTGVSMTQTYEYFREEQPDPLWKESVDGFKRLNKDLPEDYVECFSFMTSVIEMPIYLQWLMNRYEELGGNHKVKRINNFSNISEQYNLIVNCTGLESKTLLNDSEVYPVRGQIIRVKTDIKEMYLDQQISTLAYIVPRSEDMILGGVAQNNDWSLETRMEDRDNILEKCCKLIPELKNAEIIEDMVGLRPGRSEVRLEKEILLGRPMIHNYGHGGSGVTLSWGCADDVVELANES